MPSLQITADYAQNNVPYTCIAGGKGTLVVFDGLDFSHKPVPAWQVRLMPGYLKPILPQYTVYQVRRRPNLPRGYSIKDMAADYAVYIEQEFNCPVDVMGLSTGGTIAQQFAADFPKLTRRLVLGSAGARLSPTGKAIQLKMLRLAKEGKPRWAAVALADAMAKGIGQFFMRIMMLIMGRSIAAPGGKSSDGIIELEAEDRFDFRLRLKDIKAPTLVIGGDDDYFYNLKELADGIPGAKVIIYSNAGHMSIMSERFGKDVLAFLTA